MNLLGIHLTLLIGETVPAPASSFVVENLRSVEVTQRDEGPSGFQMTFHVGRSSAIDLLDYRLLTNPVLKPFSRVVLVVQFAVVPVVLMDGIITNQQLSPGNEPGAATLTVTGEDVSVMMDLEQKKRPLLSPLDNLTVAEVLAPYLGQFGMAPIILPPTRMIARNPIEDNQNQASTDRAFIQMLAERHGNVFYIEPGPAPLTNKAYWGPPNRLDVPQSALSVNMGPDTNVDSISFSYNALAAHKVTFTEGGKDRTISSPSDTRTSILLAKKRAALQRNVFLAETGPYVETRAQGQVDRSLDEVVTATGELDVLRYNGLLKPRGVVGLRGAGQSYDGQYYVKNVTSKLDKGQFKQNFALAREGTGALLPIVRP